MTTDEGFSIDLLGKNFSVLNMLPSHFLGNVYQVPLIAYRNRTTLLRVQLQFVRLSANVSAELIA